MFKKLLLSFATLVVSYQFAHAGFKTNNLVVDNGVKTSTFTMTTGAGTGKVMQSDSYGNGTWVTPVSGLTDHAQLSSTGTLTHSQLESNATTEITNRTDADNAIGVSTGSLRTDLGTETTNRTNADNALGVSTGTLRTDLTNSVNAIGVSTGSIRSDLTTETNDRVAGDNALGVSTGTLRSDLTTETNNRTSADNAIGVSTASIRSDLTTETSNRTNADNAIGVSTASIRSDLTTETNNRISADNLLGAATGQLRSDVNGKFSSSGGTISGDVNMTGYTLTVDTIAVQHIDAYSLTVTSVNATVVHTTWTACDNYYPDKTSIQNFHSNVSVAGSVDATGYTVIGDTITAVKSVTVGTGTTDGVYHGSPVVDGSWKTVVEGNDLVTYSRISGVWVEAYRAIP